MTSDRRLLDAVQRITFQLDIRRNPELDGLPETLCRALKVQEEAGELAQAVIGVLGQNPRKGVTHSWYDVITEAIDVALSALVLAETVVDDLGPDKGLAELLSDRLDYLKHRAAQSGAPNLPTGPHPSGEGR